MLATPQVWRELQNSMHLIVNIYDTLYKPVRFLVALIAAIKQQHFSYRSMPISLVGIRLGITFYSLSSWSFSAKTCLHHSTTFGYFSAMRLRITVLSSREILKCLSS